MNLSLEFKHAARSLTRHRSVAVYTSLALAMSLGLSGALYPVVRSVLIAPLPAVDGERLVTAREVIELREFETITSTVTIFESVAAHTTLTVGAEVGDRPRFLQVTFGTPNYFETLGVGILLGDSLTTQALSDGGPVPVVFSESFWRSEFGSDRSVIGQNIRIGEALGVVVGVAARGFSGLRMGTAVEVFTTLSAGPAVLGITPFEFEDQRSVELIARYDSNATINQAQTQIESFGIISRAVGEREMSPMRLVPVNAAAVPFQETSDFVMVLGGAALVMFLVGCLNATSILYVHSLVRKEEFATKLSLGCGLGRMIRTFLLEAIAIVVPAALFGMIIANVLVSVWARFTIPGQVALEELTVDPRFIGVFTLGAVCLIVVVNAVVPTLELQRLKKRLPLALSGRLSARRISPLIRYLMLSSQVAISLVLIIGLGLFLRTLKNVYGTDLGFEADKIVIAPVLLMPNQYSLDEARVFRQQLTDRVRAIPGVDGVGVTTSLFGAFSVRERVTMVGGDREDVTRVVTEYVSPGYLSEMRIPIIVGRELTTGDIATAPRVAVVNENFAGQLSTASYAEVLGRRVTFGNLEPVTIVGIARNITHVTFREAEQPALYLPREQTSDPITTLYTILTLYTERSDGDFLATVERTIRTFFQETDPGLPVPPVSTAEQILAGTLGTQRMAASLFGSFGIAGLLLTLVGTYAYVGYLIYERKRELAIRVAVGAGPYRILGHISSWVCLPFGIGAAMGVWVSVQLGGLIQAFLYQVESQDPPTYFFAVSLLAAAVLAATVIQVIRFNVTPFNKLIAD